MPLMEVAVVNLAVKPITREKIIIWVKVVIFEDLSPDMYPAVTNWMLMRRVLQSQRLHHQWILIIDI